MKTILIHVVVALCSVLPSFGQTQTVDHHQDLKGEITVNIQKEAFKNINLDIPMIGIVSVKNASKAVQEATAAFNTASIYRELEILSLFWVPDVEIEKFNQPSKLEEE